MLTSGWRLQGGILLYLRNALKVTLGAVATLLVAYLTLWFVATRDATSTWSIQPLSLEIPVDTAAASRGRKIAVLAGGCVACHSPDLSGRTLVQNKLLTLVAPNISGGDGSPAADYEVSDWVRALRHGVRPDGTPIEIMPIAAIRGLARSDLADLIAYLSHVSPVDGEQRASNFSGPVRIMAYFGLGTPIPATTIDHDAPLRESAPGPGPTLEYGEYLAQVACAPCHGNNFSGGFREVGETFAKNVLKQPPAGNLTPHAEGIGAWSEDDFVKAIRHGRRPDESLIDPQWMGWPRISSVISDDELHGLWLYLGSLLPLKTGKS
jgi:mono/diheme cytochrome c family protein